MSEERHCERCGMWLSHLGMNHECEPKPERAADPFDAISSLRTNYGPTATPGAIRIAGFDDLGPLPAAVSMGRPLAEIDRDKALAQLEALRAALPKCGDYIDDPGHRVGTCPRVCTKRNHPDSIDTTWAMCDEHALPKFVDLPWAAAVRELGW